MNLSNEDIEAILRQAPTPTPPPPLKAALQSALRRQPAVAATVNSRQTYPGRSSSGWRRWWPVILPAAATAAFAATLAVQELEKRELQQEILGLQARVAAAEAVLEPVAATRSTLNPPDPQAELVRLEALAETLNTEVAAGEALRLDNDRLREAIAETQRKVPAEFQGSQEAAERSRRIQCVNNMKQLGLAVRIWATDNSDQFPPDILSISNEVSATKILICPSDESRQPAENWATFTPANCSYEFLAPGPGTHEAEPQRVMWRCPIHQNVTLCDGSVQQLNLAKNPGLLNVRDGALYMSSGNPTVRLDAQGTVEEVSETFSVELDATHNGSGAPAGTTGTMVIVNDANGDPNAGPRLSAELAQRYGLITGSITVVLTNGPPADAEIVVESAPEP